MSDALDVGELREAVRSVLSDRIGDAIDIPDEGGRGLDRSLWSEMAGLGWLGLAVPEAHGGLGLGPGHLAVLYEELGRYLASAPVLETMIAASAIASAGGAAAQARWLPEIVAGECLAALALPDGGIATCEPDGRISGSIDHVPFADVATLLLVPVRTAAATTLALIPIGLPGVAVRPRPIVDLTRSIGRIELDAVQVEPSAMLPLGGVGWRTVANHAAIGVACDAAGGASALLDRTVDYLKVREQFGRPIGSFQALKHRLADWKVEIEAITTLARHAGALLGAESGDASAAASGAKAYAADTYAAFAGDAVQLHGGIGFTWEHPCHLFLKRAKLSQQLYGSSAAHKDRAACFAFDILAEAEAAPAPVLHIV